MRNVVVGDRTFRIESASGIDRAGAEARILYLELVDGFGLDIYMRKSKDPGCGCGHISATAMEITTRAF